MAKHSCRKFESCEAPLCPIDEESLKFGTWYPDEAICPLQKFGKLPFIKSQKKVAKKAPSLDGYFTLQMLNRKFVVGSAIIGLNPDHDESTEKTQLRKWLEDHPESKPISEEMRQIRRERFLKIRETTSQKQAIRIEGSD